MDFRNISLLEALQLLGRNPNVELRTDRRTAFLLGQLIVTSTGCSRLGSAFFGHPYITMYAGVTIRGEPEPVDKWREHFGPLAEIWGD